jgi:hypothetical protein
MENFPIILCHCGEILGISIAERTGGADGYNLLLGCVKSSLPFAFLNGATSYASFCVDLLHGLKSCMISACTSVDRVWINRTRKVKCKANASRFIFFAADSILERDTRSVQSASLSYTNRILFAPDNKSLKISSS